MTLNATKFGLACAITVIIFWLIYSFLFMLMPIDLMGLRGHMMHGDFTGVQWQLKPHSLFFGLVSWAIIAGVGGWLIAVIYNKLSGDN